MLESSDGFCRKKQLYDFLGSGRGVVASSCSLSRSGGDMGSVERRWISIALSIDTPDRRAGRTLLGLGANAIGATD